MKYTEEYLKHYNIKISVISESTFRPKLVIRADKYEELYTLNANNVQYIHNDNLDIVEFYIEHFISRHIVYIRKKKLERLNEI